MVVKWVGPIGGGGTAPVDAPDARAILHPSDGGCRRSLTPAESLETGSPIQRTSISPIDPVRCGAEAIPGAIPTGPSVELLSRYCCYVANDGKETREIDKISDQKLY
jgi:hypothetical protein